MSIAEFKPTPLANEFVHRTDASKQQKEYPLWLAMCGKCKHVQLPVVVDPAVLFRNYVYVSGTSPVFIKHLRHQAELRVAEFQLKPGDLVVEFGSNDGTMLQGFKDAHMKVLGIDPARNIADQATANGIPTIPEFFDENLARELVRHHGNPAMVVANNVFAHIDDLPSIVRAVRTLCNESTVFVFEVAYLGKLVANNYFDQVYHEHLSYHHVRPLIQLFEANGMKLFDVELTDTHGGSIRGFANLKSSMVNRVAEGRLEPFVEAEERLEDPATYNAMMERVAALGIKLGGRLSEITKRGGRIAGFGAPAKATTLMYQLSLGRESIEFLVDDSPWKQGLYSPGSHIEVVDAGAFYARRPDYALVLAWNFAESIIAKHHRFKDVGGTWIVPLPEYREV